MATDAEELDETIAEVAANPAQTSVDGVVVQERPLADLIAAQKHLAGKTAAGKSSRGLRISVLNPPGSV